VGRAATNFRPWPWFPSPSIPFTSLFSGLGRFLSPFGIPFLFHPFLISPPYLVLSFFIIYFGDSFGILPVLFPSYVVTVDGWVEEGGSPGNATGIQGRWLRTLSGHGRNLNLPTTDFRPSSPIMGPDTVTPSLLLPCLPLLRLGEALALVSFSFVPHALFLGLLGPDAFAVRLPF
jgi:hypothetical protein